MRKLILSPVGTSLLTSKASQGERKLLWKSANATEAETPTDVARLVERLSEEMADSVADATVLDLKKASAELNAIFSVYGDEPAQGKGDVHYLVATDTYQCQVTADIVRQHLERHGMQVNVICPPGFNTKDKRSFSDGIKAILKECFDFLPGYRKAGYEVVFNVTGGFKGLLGYLHTIGMFLADRLVYLFEGSELIQIPRLPVQIDKGVFGDHAATFLFMSEDGGATEAMVQGIPGSLVDEIDEGTFTTSVWGELVWNQVKDDSLGTVPLELPRLTYTKRFIREFGEAGRDEGRMGNHHRLARVSALLEEADGATAALSRDGSVMLSILRNKKTDDGSPISHFRVPHNGERVSCVTKDGGLTLRRIGSHDDVNNNP